MIWSQSLLIRSDFNTFIREHWLGVYSRSWFLMSVPGWFSNTWNQQQTENIDRIIDLRTWKTHYDVVTHLHQASADINKWDSQKRHRKDKFDSTVKWSTHTVVFSHHYWLLTHTQSKCVWNQGAVTGVSTLRQGVSVDLSFCMLVRNGVCLEREDEV